MKKLVCELCGTQYDLSKEISQCQICSDYVFRVINVRKLPKLPNKPDRLIQLHQKVQEEISQLSEEFEGCLKKAPFAEKIENGSLSVGVFGEFMDAMRDVHEIKYPPFDYAYDSERQQHRRWLQFRASWLAMIPQDVRDNYFGDTESRATEELARLQDEISFKRRILEGVEVKAALLGINLSDSGGQKFSPSQFGGKELCITVSYSKAGNHDLEKLAKILTHKAKIYDTGGYSDPEEWYKSNPSAFKQHVYKLRKRAKDKEWWDHIPEDYYLSYI